MKDMIRKLFLRDPLKPRFWLLLALLLKGIPFLILLINKPVNDIPGFIGGTMGDSPSYLNPIDNLLSSGIYTPDYRMPGYGIIYLLFRMVAPKALACNLLILAQLLLAAASVYFLSLSAMKLIKSKPAFYITFYLMLVSTYSNFYDGYLITESFCTSALIFSIYFFIIYFESANLKYIFYSGFFLTWVIFLRPVFLPILLAYIIIFVMNSRRMRLPFSKAILIFILPFILCDGAWITRNYVRHNRFFPLTSSVLYPQVSNLFIVQLTDFVQAWGGCTGYSDNHSELGWFGYSIPGTVKSTTYDSLPANIYTTAFNKDSLIAVKKLIAIYQSPTVDTLTKNYINTELKSKLEKYRSSIIQEKPLLYYVVSPVKLLGKFLYGEETRLYMKRGQVFKGFGFLIEGFYTIFYLLILITGILGLGLLIFKGFRKEILVLLLVSVPLYDIFVHPIFLRFALNRYLMPAWPFLIACATYCLIAAYNRFFRA